MPITSSITPDGKMLLYTMGPRTMVLPMNGVRPAGDPKPLRESTTGERQAQISPDGKLVAFTSNESGAPELYVMPFPGPGPKVRVSTQTANAPRWNRNGRELLYWTAAGSASVMTASIQESPTVSAGVPTELFKMILGTTWDVMPDGQHFLVEITRNTGNGSTFATVTNWFEELRRRAPARK
jgi:serine/threonine-protein kinase